MKYDKITISALNKLASRNNQDTFYKATFALRVVHSCKYVYFYCFYYHYNYEHIKYTSLSVYIYLILILLYIFK